MIDVFIWEFELDTCVSIELRFGSLQFYHLIIFLIFGVQELIDLENNNIGNGLIGCIQYFTEADGNSSLVTGYIHTDDGQIIVNFFNDVRQLDLFILIINLNILIVPKYKIPAL